MVNENLIPKTETVYELKNEIPSFEDFMKTYESDGSLNYDDLSSGGVGEAEGYGPCRYKNDNCSCDCSREDYPRCNCIYDEGYERWCDLKLRCPICPASSSNYVREWGHSGHTWYGVRISNKARIRCNKTDCRTEQIRYWNFKCSNHDGEPLSKNVSFTRAVVNVINAKENANTTDAKLLTDLLTYMDSHSWSQGY